MSANDLMKSVSTRRLLLTVIPILLTLVSLGAAAFGRSLVDWKVRADTSLADLQKFKTQSEVEVTNNHTRLDGLDTDLKAIRQLQIEQYRDLLRFQRDVYRAAGEGEKARELHNKAESLK